MSKGSWGTYKMILTGEIRNIVLEISTCPLSTMLTINPTWTDLGMNPCFRGKVTTTTRLRYGRYLTLKGARNFVLCILFYVVGLQKY